MYPRSPTIISRSMTVASMPPVVLGEHKWQYVTYRQTKKKGKTYNCLIHRMNRTLSIKTFEMPEHSEFERLKITESWQNRMR